MTDSRSKLTGSAYFPRTLLLASTILALAACGDDGGSNVGDVSDVGDIGDVADVNDVGGSADADADADAGTGDGGVPTSLNATERGPVGRGRSIACRIDLDCDAGTFCFYGYCGSACESDAECGERETCDSDGRCASGSDNKSGDAAGSVDFRYSTLPDTSQRLPLDATETRLEVRLEGTEIPARIQFRISDSAGIVDFEHVWETDVAADGTVVFEVPIGIDDVMAAEEEIVAVQVTSDAGLFEVAIVPAVPIAGIYGASARIARFGSLRLPFEFQIVTDPVGSSLEDANTAWLLLPVGEDQFLSPVPPGADAPTVAAELEYDALVSSWVARFDNAYSFSSDSLFSYLEDQQTGRSLRIELVDEGDGYLSGRFSDRWTGIYESRTADGLLSPAVVLFDGEFEAFWSGDSVVEPAEVTVPTPEASESVALPLPALDACDEAFLLDLPAWDLDLATVDCTGITTMSEFEDADPELRAGCAIALAEDALTNQSTASMVLDFFDGDDVTPGGRSFAEFMEDCAAGVDGLCRPTGEVLCGRQMTAYAFVAPEFDVEVSADLIDVYSRATREAFLGRQLGAFQSDSEMRLAWLQATDFPAIVTAVLRDHTAQLLDDWVATVLDVHFDVLAGQYDASGLALLSRQPSSDDAITARRELLFEMSQSWRASMDALTLAASRWNALFQSADDRADATSEVAGRMLDLYLMAGVASNLNLRAGAGFANATFGGGFGALVRETRRLSLPFDELIYARDAEVVVARSLDPESDNYNLLGRLEEYAREEIEQAGVSVQTVIDAANERSLNEAEVRNRLSNEITELRNELVQKCGLPVGCTVRDYGVRPECEVRTAPGECGFLFEGQDYAAFDSASQNVSDGGASLLAIQSAIISVHIAEDELNTVSQRAQLGFESADVFADQIEQWNDTRLATIDEFASMVDERRDEWSDAFAEMADGIVERNELRRQLAEDAQVDASAWDSIRVGGLRSDFRTQTQASALQRTSDTITRAANWAKEKTRAMIEGMPRSVGTASDPSFAARMATTLSGSTVRKVMQVSAVATAAAARGVQRSAERSALLRDAELTNLREQDIADDQEVLAEIQNLADLAELEIASQRAREEDVNRMLDLLKLRAEAELAYQRDIVELRDRRDQVFSGLLEESTLALRIEQAQVGIQQRVLEYLQSAQAAELELERLNELENQRQNINLLLGSPSVVFAWANRLVQAENQLDGAKQSVMEWLVALEYYAVRPFMDQRIQILLAQNAYQLEDIADEMLRLQNVCGGQLNQQSATISVARAVSVQDALVDPDTSEITTSAERFRSVLAAGDVSVNKRVRISTEITAGSALLSDGVLAVTVPIDIDAFANLGSSCNAKIVSFDVALYGENLGDAQPTVTIIYDGTSRMRSCQPDLDDYVAQFGPNATSFGPVTTFRSPSRAISPVAGIGEFPGDSDGSSGNLTLSGLPLSSTYTVVIDPTVGENSRIAWNRLSDIELRVNYLYQDFFTSGECQ